MAGDDGALQAEIALGLVSAKKRSSKVRHGEARI
jgi:hypothetical protein